MYIGLHVKYRLLLDFNETWILWTDFSENTQISNLMKIRAVEAELFRADRRTHMTKLIVACRHFANAPNVRRMDIIPTSLREACCVGVRHRWQRQPELPTLISLHVKMPDATRIKRATAREQTDGFASRVTSRTRNVKFQNILYIVVNSRS